MKLIKDRFGSYAREQGYENGAELYEDLGLKRNVYKHYRNEVPINGETLRVICWGLGTIVTMDFVSLNETERQKYRRILDEF